MTVQAVHSVHSVLTDLVDIPHLQAVHPSLLTPPVCWQGQLGSLLEEEAQKKGIILILIIIIIVIIIINTIILIIIMIIIVSIKTITIITKNSLNILPQSESSLYFSVIQPLPKQPYSNPTSLLPL